MIKLISRLVGLEALSTALGIAFSLLVVLRSSPDEYAKIALVYAYLGAIEAFTKMKQEQKYIRATTPNGPDFSVSERLLGYHAYSVIPVMVTGLFAGFIYFLSFDQRSLFLLAVGFAIPNWLLATLSYSKNIAGKHELAVAIQIFCAALGLMMLAAAALLGIEMNAALILFVRMATLIALIVGFQRQEFVILAGNFIRAARAQRIIQTLREIDLRIYFLNLIPGLYFSAPLILVEAVGGRDLTKRVALAKQVADTLFKVLPSATSSMLLDHLSRRDSFVRSHQQRAPAEPRQRRVEIVAIALVVLVLVPAIASSFVPVLVKVLGKPFDLSAAECYFVVLNSFTAIVANFAVVYFIGASREWSGIKTFALSALVFVVTSGVGYGVTGGGSVLIWLGVSGVLACMIVVFYVLFSHELSST